MVLAAASALLSTGCIAAVPEAGNGLRAPAPGSHLGGGAEWAGGGLKARRVHPLLLGTSNGLAVPRWSMVRRLDPVPAIGAPVSSELAELLDLARGARLGVARVGGAFMACGAASATSIALRP